MKIENVTFLHISSKCNLKIEIYSTPKNILTIQLCQYIAYDLLSPDGVYLTINC